MPIYVIYISKDTTKYWEKTLCKLLYVVDVPVNSPWLVILLKCFSFDYLWLYRPSTLSLIPSEHMMSLSQTVLCLWSQTAWYVFWVEFPALKIQMYQRSFAQMKYAHCFNALPQSLRLVISRHFLQRLKTFISSNVKLAMFRATFIATSR